MLSEKIRELRRTKGLSQEELAERLNVSRQAVSKWETGAAVPTTETLIELADCFGVSLDYLIRNDCSTGQPERPSAKKKHSAAKRILGAFLLGAAVFAVIVLVILQLTGYGGSVKDSSAVTLDGNGIVIGTAVLCAVGGIAILITSRK